LGIICCTRQVGVEPAQAVMNRYVTAAMRHADCAALLVPALPDLMTAEEVIDRLDGVLLTGSPSNVQPALYGEEHVGDPPFDPGRDALMAALVKGDTLSVKLLATDGRPLLQDVLYTDGFESALARAGVAAGDEAIVRPIVERCMQFADRDEAFWKIADVTAALVVCDPRLPERRR
jgi:hypothetical protein